MEVNSNISSTSMENAVRIDVLCGPEQAVCDCSDIECDGGEIIDIISDKQDNVNRYRRSYIDTNDTCRDEDTVCRLREMDRYSKTDVATSCINNKKMHAQHIEETHEIKKGNGRNNKIESYKKERYKFDRRYNLEEATETQSDLRLGLENLKSKTFLIDSILGNDKRKNAAETISDDSDMNDDNVDEQNVSSTSACISGGPELLASSAYAHWMGTHAASSGFLGDKCTRRPRRMGPDRKPRQAYSAKQLERLESEFKVDKYLSVSKRMELSKALVLTEVQIKTWFQNRRTKWKKQLTSRLKIAQRQGLFPTHLFPSTPYSLLGSYAYSNFGVFGPHLSHTQNN